MRECDLYCLVCGEYCGEGRIICEECEGKLRAALKIRKMLYEESKRAKRAAEAHQSKKTKRTVDPHQ